MSFDFPQQPQPQPRRGGCGRLIFMLMIMFAVYYFFSGAFGGPGQQQNQQQAPNQQRLPNRPSNQREDIFGNGRVPSADGKEDLKNDIFGDGRVDSQGRPVDDSGLRMPTKKQSGRNGDWEMDDVNATGNQRRSNQRTTRDRNDGRNDWSIENVDPVTAERESVPAVKPAPTNQGGWTLEEVETK